MEFKKVAVLTSGGDSPGMNACIRAVVKSALNFNIECIGIFDGFQGLIEKRSCLLNYAHVNNIIQKGGTILGTARSEEFRTKEGRVKAIKYLKRTRCKWSYCYWWRWIFQRSKNTWR